LKKSDTWFNAWNWDTDTDIHTQTHGRAK